MKAFGIKKWIRSMALVTAVMTAAAFTGCGTASEAKSLGAGSDSAASGKQDNGKELKEMKVILDWTPNAIHTFLYDAEEKGYFAEEGIKVTIIPPGSECGCCDLCFYRKSGHRSHLSSGDSGGQRTPRIFTFMPSAR